MLKKFVTKIKQNTRHKEIQYLKSEIEDVKAELSTRLKLIELQLKDMEK